MKKDILRVIMLSFALVSLAAPAAETQKKVGKDTVVINARPATKGEGYSTYSFIKRKGALGVKPLDVSVTCSCRDGSSATKSCPTTSYQCNCPNASISCD